MKAYKLLSACAASLLFASAAFGYEAKAKVTMEGNIIKQTHEAGKDATFSFLNLDPVTDKSKNGISVDVDGGITGAHFELFYVIDGANKAEDGWKVSARKTHLWFTPVDALKFRIGYVGDDSFFCERVDEEKVGNPFSAEWRKSGLVPEYITNADVDEMGFSLAVTPIDGLTVSGAIAPGIGKTGISSEEDSKYAQWGVTAKYDINENVQVQASFRDNGKDSWKVARFGLGYKTENLLAFFQPVLGFDNVKYKKKGTPADSKDEKDFYYESEMRGIAFDMYGDYKIDEWKFTAHLPLTIRTEGKDGDSSYIEPLVMVSYNLGIVALLDDFTPYLKVESFENPWLFDEMGDTMNMNIQPGVTFKAGNLEVDLGISVQLHSAEEISGSSKCTFAIPFTASMKF
ncbi:MAG: hypothetical protein KBT11_07175 [Treponema sp.]|nr:hypothetical protein [Candidatus Treponema equifaecale]